MFYHLGVGLGHGPEPASTPVYQGQPPLNLRYRPLQQSDYDALKTIHRDLFPIDYEEVFFRKAVAGEDRVFSWAALHNEYDKDYLVGFVTARTVYLYECDPLDRQVMGLTAKCMDGEAAVYVLTLGVVPGCRQCGVARSLLGLVQRHATRLRCRAVFLHVIAYNNPAMRLYGTSGYQAMARLPNFYHLVTGRQPNPDQSWYDAFLYALFLPPSGPELSPAMQWAGGMLGAAVAPLRSVWGTFNGCMPTWLCRQTYSTCLPFAAAGACGGGGSALQHSASKGSLADTATSAWQPQPQRSPSPVPPHSQPSQSHPSQQQQQQQALPMSSGAGVVCGGVTAEHFLRQGSQHHQHQHYNHHHQHHQKDSAAERRQLDCSSSGAGTGPQSQTQQQYLQYAAVSGSYVLDLGGRTGGGSSSGASSASVVVSAEQLSHHHPTSVAQFLGRQQQRQPQQQYTCGGGGTVLLRPPSPPIPPSLAPSLSSLQQRHPHSSGNGGSTVAAHVGGGSSGPTGNRRSHQWQQHHHHQQHLAVGTQYGNSEHARGGAHRGGPQGLAGSDLHSQFSQHHQQQQQQGGGGGGGGGGSMLAALFRPPTAQQHPRTR